MLSPTSTIRTGATPAIETTEAVTMATQSTVIRKTTEKSDVTKRNRSNSISLLDDVDADADADADVDTDIDVIVDVDSVATKTLHFLDYDTAPTPPNDPVVSLAKSDKQTIEYHSAGKSFENKTESVTDQELGDSGYSKKEFTQDDNTLTTSTLVVGQEHRKEILNENFILTNCLLKNDAPKQQREHHSLDRNFERHNEQRLLALPFGNVRSSRDRLKESSTFGFLKGISWTQSFDSRHYYYGTQAEKMDKLDKLGSKVECVYSLLSMLGSNDPLEMAKKFYELSRSPETCITLRKSGCIPLLVQMLHADGGMDEVRKWAGMALHNVVHSHPDEKCGRREAKILRLLDQIMDYCIFLRSLLQSGGEAIADDADRHPLAAISSLMKGSFDEEQRHSMCELGALQAIPNLVHLDHAVHGPRPEHQCCNSLRRFALMALTNLTFGDENNKALLCSQKVFMEALVAQLDSAPDDLLQVTASVLRNLSWQADSQMKVVLNEIGTVTSLAKAAMKNKCENTLKAILSALWNLSAHCSTNKAEFCAVDGSLSFIVQMLTYEGPSKTLKIIENAGGILRNVSSHIAVREDYRKILRQHNCLAILLQQLKSESLTVVSNSCGTLWNLSARCPEDQRFLWDNGAVPMLRSLIHSKHSMIAEGSSNALKNLLHFRPSMQNTNQSDPITRSLNLKKLPTLNVRKQKALEQEFSIASTSHLSKINDTATTTSKYIQRNNLTGNKSLAVTPTVNVNGRLTRSAMLSKSESGDSIFTSKSDTAIYEQFIRSHSASDSGNRKYKPLSTTRTKAFALDRDRDRDCDHDHDHVRDRDRDRDEQTEEKPIDYSAKYNENISTTSNHELNKDQNIPTKSTTYQETDLDQPTDFSLLYAEKNSGSEAISNSNLLNHAVKQQSEVIKPESEGNTTKSDNEIVLIMEDTVKCYKTEDTPYVISNAGSTTDIRLSTITSTKIEPDDLSPNAIQASTISISTSTVAQIPNRKANKLQERPSITGNAYATGSGTYTPEKPINYCEEGTPGYFSRYDSFNSLDEASNHLQAEKSLDNRNVIKEPLNEETNRMKTLKLETNSIKNHQTNPEEGVVPSELQVNSALETPLMFSRYSSLDSLVEEDVCPIDDKSSVVSEFSRLASGIISPSEIPDSPSQSMPHSPKGRSTLEAQPTTRNYINDRSPLIERDTKTRVKSVFEDNLNTFHVENTPAQISTATSLSNLSIADDEPPSQNGDCTAKQPLTTFKSIISEEEEEEEDANDESSNDDALLASCINMGMSRLSTNNLYKQEAKLPIMNTELIQDETKKFYTEDTPALLSKVCSNTNLSALSMSSVNNRDGPDDNIYEVVQRRKPSPTSTASNPNAQMQTARHSLNFSDDMSSNASESGAVSANFDILQQCIRDGMQRSSKVKINPTHKRENELMLNLDPIDMLRSGGNTLPPYLPVNDEVNKYLIEDSPCNFSITSGLSNLTVGSSLVGPALQLNDKCQQSNKNKQTSGTKLNEGKSSRLTEGGPSPSSVNSTLAEGVCNAPQWQDDSLSSLSMESEDDTNLLSQAIAAGCKRPSTNSMVTTSLAASQPQFQYINSNESYSSIDSSDSNDNQSKSLLELCILKGMHKTHDTNRYHNTDANINSSISANPFVRSAHMPQNKMTTASESAGIQSHMNIKQFDSLPINGTQLSANRHLRELEMRDEKLLMECINTGIMTKIGETSKAKQMILSTNQPKNLQATSAAASIEELHHPTNVEPITTVIHQMMNNNNKAAPDVETIENINTTSTHTINSSTSTSTYQNSLNINHASVIGAQERLKLQNQIAISEAVHPNHVIDSETMNAIGYKTNNCTIPLTCDSKDDFNQSFILEPVVSLENKHPDQVNTINCKAGSDKHKDPDLMLKSVERLTMEFVSSAEQLRLQNSSQATTDVAQINKAFSPSTQSLISILPEDQVSKEQSSSGAPANNTWNEDTCPNDVSFPSISVTVPKGVSLTYEDNYDSDFDNFDHTNGDFKELNDISENIAYSNEALLDLNFSNNDHPNTKSSQPNSLEPYTEIETTLKDASTPNNINYSIGNNSENLLTNGLNFKLGGKVQCAAMVPSLLCSMNPLTNSGFIAAEAHKLAINLQEATNNDDEMSFSNTSLDLDNIRPPSGMDSLNLSGYYHDNALDNGSNNAQPQSLQRLYIDTQSPQLSTKSPKFTRKSLPSGLVARRALGQLPNHIAGSMDSVTSSCNIMLDNIKPPSLMDELLDSMISVASIQSEIAEDCPSLATTVSLSNYETAGNNNNTLTMQSCCNNLTHDDDLTNSEGNITPLPSDIEYSSVDSTPQKSHNTADSAKGSLTPKEKRKLIKDRFKTYTIVSDVPTNAVGQQHDYNSENSLQNEMNQNTKTGDEESFNNIDNQQTARCRRRTSNDRYKTQTIVYSTSSLHSSELSNSNTSEKLNSTLNTVNGNHNDSDLTSFEYEQHSGTESSYDLNVTTISDNEPEPKQEILTKTQTISPTIYQNPPILPNGKPIKGNIQESYVSPYSKLQLRNNNNETKCNPRVTRNNTRTKLNIKPTPSANNFNNSSNTVIRKRNTDSMPPNGFTYKKQTQKQNLQQTSPTTPTNRQSAKPSNLERQGTFTKDEPSVDKAVIPIVDDSIQQNKFKASKLPTTRQSSIATRKVTTALANGRRVSSYSASPQRANTTVNMKKTTNVYTKRISSTTPPTRSNSTLNNLAISNASANSTGRLQQSQSRLAGIWRHSNETKSRQTSSRLANTSNNVKGKPLQATNFKYGNSYANANCNKTKVTITPTASRAHGSTKPTTTTKRW